MVHDIAAAPDGSMWFTNAWPSGRATGYPVGGVLRRLPDGTWLRYGTEHGLPDDKALDQQGYLSGELTLEDGRTLSFEIQDGAEGAQWNVLEDQPAKGAEERTREGVGLSTLEPPGGV